MLGIRTFAKRRWNQCIYRHRRTTLPIVLDTGGRLGFFAALTWCVALSNACRVQSRTPWFRLSQRSPYAGRNFDALNDTLAQRSVRARIPAFAVRIRTLDDFPVLDSIPPLTFENANSLFFEQFRIPEKLTKLSETIASVKGSDAFLAIHYRGTDKACEGYYPTPTEFLDAFAHQASVRHHDVRNVFIATDVPSFLELAKARLSHYRLFTNDDQIKANGKTAIHFSDLGRKAPQALAEDAILNCLILSRARLLVKTPSILSGWAKVLNPKLEVALVGELREHARWFPDSLLMAKTPI